MKKLLLLLPFLALVPALSANAADTAEEESLMEFEQTTDNLRLFQEALRAGLLPNSVRVQQYDTQAQEVNPEDSPQDYQSAVMDPYYGYKLFILVNKSKGSIHSRNRQMTKLTPQSLYIFERSGDELRPVDAVPVSTGLEPGPGQLDTHEGFFRLQSAQPQYTSRKFGSSMPFSLWFESEYGTAIHQTPQSACDNNIGLRASHGCVRLCPGDAEKVFKKATGGNLPRSSAIVLLDKRSGRPMGRRADVTKSLNNADLDANGTYASSPRVVRGFPVFIRVIDGTTPEKVQEMKTLVEDPTRGFKRYFRPFSNQALQSQQAI